MKRKIQKYGWRPDLPDFRDLCYTPEVAAFAALPASVDLRPQCPPVYDQGKLGSCTANAISCAIEFDQMKQQETVFNPSRLFIYYNERDIEGDIDQDNGAQIRDGIKACASLGACDEQIWPYDISKFADKPSDAAYSAAAAHTITKYLSIAQDPNHIKAALAEGTPVVFGFTVYDSFEGEDVARTGELNMPVSGEATVGGHAVIIVGYDDATQRYTVRNSWSDQWGQKGYFTMPYEYVHNPSLASDFWAIYTTK